MSFVCAHVDYREEIICFMSSFVSVLFSFNSWKRKFEDLEEKIAPFQVSILEMFNFVRLQPVADTREGRGNKGPTTTNNIRKPLIVS